MKFYIKMLASTLLLSTVFSNCTAVYAEDISEGIRDEQLAGRGYSDIGRDEPQYVNHIGYVVVDQYDYDLKQTDVFQETPWMVPVYSKDGADYTETGSVEHKTEVLVKAQELEHEGYGSYSGYLNVKCVETEEEFFINVGNFVTNPYWNSSDLTAAASDGYFIAEYGQSSNYLPVNKKNETVELDQEIQVLITGTTGTYGHGPDRDIYPIEATVFKEWAYGYGGVPVFFHPNDLTIVY